MLLVFFESRGNSRWITFSNRSCCLASKSYYSGENHLSQMAQRKYPSIFREVHKPAININDMFSLNARFLRDGIQKIVGLL